MNSLELLLTFVFIVIIIVIGDKIPSELIVGTIALVFVIFWIGFDNMGAWSNPYMNNIMEKCGLKNIKNIQEKRKEKKLTDIKKKVQTKKANKLENKLENINKDDIENSQIKEKIADAIKNTKNKPIPVAVPRPMPLTYSEENYKYNLFDEIGCLGDNLLAHKMKQVSNKNREAMDNFSRTYSKYSNINYFEQELNDAANSRWWDNDELEKKF